MPFSLTAERTTILVAEDDPLIRDLATDVFADMGMRVSACGTADEAFDFLQHHADQVSLVFADIRMPGTLNGVDLARSIFERWPGIPVLLTSGDTFPSGLPPTVGFLPKPWSLIQLLRSAKICGLAVGH